MDWLANILTSSNFISIAVFTVILVVLLSMLSKKGVFSFHAHGIDIGNDEVERTIIREQINYAEAYTQGFLETIPKPDNYDEWHGKFVVEKMYDEIIQWIVFNHISDCESYVTIKQKKLWNVIQSITTNDTYKSEDFKNLINEGTESLIKELIKIRTYYSKNYKK